MTRREVLELVTAGLFIGGLLCGLAAAYFGVIAP